MKRLSQQTKIAIVGCGAITRQFYLPALRALQQAHHPLSIIGLIDPSLPQLEHCKAECKDAKAYKHLNELPKDTNLVVIASPHRMHASQTIEALNLGFNVLCEKPMAFSPKECIQMMDTAIQRDKLLTIGHFRRFFPAHAAIGSYIQSECFGKLLSVKWREGQPFNWPLQSPALFDKAAHGGILSDIGPHCLDLILGWLGEPSSIECATDAMGGVDTHTALKLIFPDAVACTVTLSWRVPLENCCTLQFERATLRWNIHEPSRFHVLDTHIGLSTYVTVDSPIQEPGHAFSAQLINILEALQGKCSLRVSPLAASKVMELIDRCQTYSTLLDQPWLDAEEKAACHKLRIQHA